MFFLAEQSTHIYITQYVEIGLFRKIDWSNFLYTKSSYKWEPSNWFKQNFKFIFLHDIFKY